MASTIQLQRTILICQQFLRLAPLTFAANPNNDPAFFCADWVKQMILAPPFTWRWNRSDATPQAPTFVTIPGQTDYPVNLPNFGWIEKATAFDPNNAYAAYELQVGLNIAQDTLPNQPARITAQLDDDNGNIVFRIFPAPDIVYNVVVQSQNAAQIFVNTTDTWAPIPDYLSYLFTSGMMAKVYEYTSDPRYQMSMQVFLSQLASTSENLTETQRNLWLKDRLVSLRETAAAQERKP